MQKVELESTLRNTLPQLATLYFVARQVGHNVVIRVTMCFNLQCNNVARQVEEKCFPYYRTLKFVTVNVSPKTKSYQAGLNSFKQVISSDPVHATGITGVEFWQLNNTSNSRVSETMLKRTH